MDADAFGRVDCGAANESLLIRFRFPTRGVQSSGATQRLSSINLDSLNATVRIRSALSVGTKRVNANEFQAPAWGSQAPSTAINYKPTIKH